MPEFSANQFIFEQLQPICGINESTRLCIYRPTQTVYVSKQIASGDVTPLRVISKIRNPHLAPILWVEDNAYGAEVVTEYVSGTSLDQLLRGGHTLPAAQAVSIADNLCDGLSKLHAAGIVHRDVNPKNVILTLDGTAVLIDYGIARGFYSDKTRDTEILGTPGYAAPEQFGFTQSDARTDIFAVGVLLNVMITGKFPQEQLADGTVGSIIRRCISLDAAKRYATVDALLADLRKKNTAVPKKFYQKWWFWLIAGLVALFLIFYVTDYHGFRTDPNFGSSPAPTSESGANAAETT